MKKVSRRVTALLLSIMLFAGEFYMFSISAKADIQTIIENNGNTTPNYVIGGYSIAVNSLNSLTVIDGGSATTYSAKDFDWHSRSNNILSGYSDDNTAIDNMVGILRNSPLFQKKKNSKTESYKLSPEVFGVNSWDEYESGLKSTLKINDSAYVNVYNTFHWSNGDDDILFYCGCDYNGDTHLYEYFVIHGEAQSNKDDDFLCMVWQSSNLILPLNGSAGSNHIWSGDSASKQAYNCIINNLSSLMGCILSSGDRDIIKDNIVAYHSNRAHTMSSDDQVRLSQLSALLNYTGDTVDGPHSVTIKDCGTGFTYGYENNKLNTIYLQNVDTSTMDVTYQEMSIVYDDSFLVFGNGAPVLNGSKVGNAAKYEDAIWEVILQSIINPICQIESANTVSALEEYANFFSETPFVHDVIMGYKEELADCVSRQAIAEKIVTVDAFNSLSSSDNFGIILTSIQYVTKCISDGKSYDGNVIKLNDNNYVKLSSKFTSTNVSTAPNDDTKKVYDVGYFWKALTPYQKAILITAVNEKYGSTNLHPKITLPNFTSYFDVEHAAKIMEGIDFDEIRNDVDEYDQSLLMVSGSVTNTARVADILGEYVVASSLYADSKDVSSIYALYNSDLDSLSNDIWTYPYMDKGWFSYLPSTIGLFDFNEYGYRGMLEAPENWKRFVAMLYNVDYAFEVFAWSDLGQENNYTPDAVRTWFKGGDNSEYPDVLKWLSNTQGLSSYDMASLHNLADGWDEDQKDLMRSIIALHKLCNFLGIEKGDWSPMIDVYLEIYEENKDFFDLLEQSGIIYSLAEVGGQSMDEPLGMFFNIGEQKMTDQWIKGFSVSALYVPMETNVYDASSILYLNDPEWVSEFFYKYAFYRKALYINTDNSAIVNAFSSGEASGSRVATLSDLLNYDRDIILTVDDNFYNANKIDTVISRLDYTAISNTDNAEDTAEGVQVVGNFISGLMDLDAGNILKTGADMYYSTTLVSKVTQLGENPDWESKIYDGYVLPAEDILGENGNPSVLDSYEYSVKMSYGVVSAVYRSSTLYNECLRGIVADNAVFKSSKAICSTPGTTSSHWRSVYNYCMLMNLEDQMKNNCATTLDLDAPIFVDIFGNIITESGLVIIPAAANATLCGTYWTPYTVGWSEYYNNGNHLTTLDFNEDVYEWLTGQKLDSILDANTPIDYTDQVASEKKNAGGYFWFSGNEVVLKTSELKSGNLTGTVQWEALNKNSTVVQNLFFNDAYYQKGKNMYSHTLTHMIVEVLRGAPIEYIDYEYEGLDGNTNISKYGVYMAYKLEELVNNLISGTNGNALGGNSVVTMPNLAFVSGIEYIMLYAFKIVFAVMIVALGVSLYLDATRNSLGIKSVGKFLLTCTMCIVAFTLLPNLISWTYYNANRNLLSDEAGRLMMMNYVKEYDGAEIGITSVTTPETNTELYMRVDSAAVSWWTIIPEVLFGNTASTVTELYQNELTDNAMAMTPGVQLKGDGLYVDVQNIFDSSDVQFTPATNTLSHYVRNGQSATVIYKEEQKGVDAFGNKIITPKQIVIGSDNTSVVSYTAPYYVFLEQLVANVNEYNVSRDVTAYSWSVGSNGHVLTYDIITPYLTSAEFLEEGYDILGLDRILGVSAPRTNYNYAFTGADEARMQKSLWWFDGIENENVARQKTDKVYEYARNFVINNSDVLGKVPDEVFIKVMAMQVAIDYNREFGVPNGNAIEIINVDTRDLMRFMVAPHSDMYKYYSYSFARYVYEQSGTIGVVFAALLLVVYWLTSFVKPALMIAILILLIVNVVFRKLLFRKESRCIEGYLIGCGCLCLFNYAYALMLKVSMSIADAGFGSVSALVVAFMIQVLYIISLLGILAIEMKDWRNNGFNEFSNIGHSLASQVIHAKNVVADRVLARRNEAYRNSADSRRYASDDYDASSVEAMLERDRERDERGAYNPD